MKQVGKRSCVRKQIARGFTLIGAPLQLGVGFIAARAGSEVALDLRLDHVRSCVLDGRPNDATHHALRLAAGADTVFLPCVGRYFPFRAVGSRAAPD